MALTVVETFVGCGGSYLGFKKAGFDTVFVNDIWEEAVTTLKTNNNELSDEQVICTDIKMLDTDVLKKQFHQLQSLDVLIGGVVCKGFSLAGVRNPCDERNYLYLEQLRLVEAFMPKLSIIENVPGMVNMKILKQDTDKQKCETLCELYEQLKKLKGRKITINKTLSNNEYKDNKEKILLENELIENEKKSKQLAEKRDSIKDELEDNMYSVVEDIEKRYESLGYKVYKKVLCCADYGSATSRKRLFIVAVRGDIKKEWTYPKPIYGEKGGDLPSWRTVRDAFNMIDYSVEDKDNVPMTHKSSTVDKFKKIEKVNKSGTYFSRGSSSRLVFDEVAPTLVPGHSSFQLHPVEHRSITVREGATITGFPTDYKFFGSHSSRCVQIGNAIPVDMAYAIALQSKHFLCSI